MYKIRITTKVEQLDHDGRVLFSTNDTTDVSAIDEQYNRVDVPRAFSLGNSELLRRIRRILVERFGE